MTEIFTPRTLQELALEWPPELDHISASSLKMAVRCPEQWRQRYVLGKITPPNEFLINGRANHAAIEHSMAQKVESFVDLPVGEVSGFFDHDFDRNIEDAGGVNEVEVRDATSKVAKQKVLDDVRRDGRNLVTYYHRTESPYIQPTAVELEFELRLHTLPVKLVGRIDLIATDNLMRLPEVIIDRKTTKKKKYKPDPEWEVQAEIYQLVKPLDHYWHVSSYKPHPLVVTDFVAKPKPMEVAQLTLDHVMGEIGYFYRRYGPDTPWPARGKLHTWACSFCGFRPDCWAWRDA